MEKKNLSKIFSLRVATIFNMGQITCLKSLFKKIFKLNKREKKLFIFKSIIFNLKLQKIIQINTNAIFVNHSHHCSPDS